MVLAKNYSSATGVDEFYYGVLQPDDVKIVETKPERVKYLQEINVDMPQEISKAYGDNGIAEMATSNGDISVTSQFHKVPMEDKTKLLGWETKTGITAAGKNDNSPYVAVIFAKTYEDGTREYVGLPKGKFMRPGVKGETKKEGVEFSSDEMTAEFMDRIVEGFEDEKSVFFAIDAKGETTNRDALFLKIFGVTHPDVVPGP
ncbi:major tail protein [Sporosarcina sp. A2]|uniref:major tail protein n=1 Tax=Sporosarcina sp. A2 TaxID=3393449 RepID=UPI003D797CEE